MEQILLTKKTMDMIDLLADLSDKSKESIVEMAIHNLYEELIVELRKKSGN